MTNHGGEMDETESKRTDVPKHKIFCFMNSGRPGLYEAMALADDGHVLAGHGCSSEDWIPHDLGIGSDWKHDKYDAHFGAGNWELVFVPRSELATHPGVAAACELAKQLDKATAAEVQP